MTIKLTKGQKIQIFDSSDVFKIMQHILLRENKLARNKEHFWIVCLNPAQQILLIELISLGSVNRVNLSPMDVFSFALQKGATKIIMVHNHPSNTLKPSGSDKQQTETMLAVGRFLKVPVIDHLIISEEGYFSFADTGLLKEIEDNSNIDLTFENVDILKSEIAKKEKDVARKNKEIERLKKQLSNKKGTSGKR